MLTKVCASLLAVAAISYGGAALYMGGCPFSGGCHSHCGGTQEAVTSSCCETPSAPSCCTESEAGCCESGDVTTGLVGACGVAVVSQRQGGTCPLQTSASQQQP